MILLGVTFFPSDNPKHTDLSYVNPTVLFSFSYRPWASALCGGWGVGGWFWICLKFCLDLSRKDVFLPRLGIVQSLYLRINLRDNGFILSVQPIMSGRSHQPQCCDTGHVGSSQEAESKEHWCSAGFLLCIQPRTSAPGMVLLH